MPRDCGSCNLCCRLLNVPDINKPAHMLCWWTGLHGGCERQCEKPDTTTILCDEETGIYSIPPGQEEKDLALLACAQFECLWLASQKREDPGEVWPRHWRPDISHVVFGPRDRDDPSFINIHIDPQHPSAWMEPEINDYIHRVILANGGKIQVHIDDRKFMVEERD